MKSKDIATRNNKIANIILLFFMFAFPLFITNKYHNITISKFSFYLVTSVLGTIICLIFAEPVQNKNRLARKKSKQKTGFVTYIKSCDKLTISFVVFLISGIFAMIFSPYPISAFCGYSGRYMGFDFILAIMLTYFFVTKYYILSEKTFVAFECSSILVVLLSVLQFFGFDIFNLRNGIASNKSMIFLSTIGNINVFASFISLCLPIAVYILCFSKNTKYLPVYIISVLFGFIGVFVANSDSAYLAVIAMLWIVLLLSMNNNRALTNFFCILSAFGALAFIFGRVYSSADKADSLSMLTRAITSVYSIIPAFIFALTAIFLKRINLSEISLKRLRKIYVIVTVLVVTSVLILIIYFTLFDKESDLGFLKNYLRFNDDWGSERGLVWRLSLSSFKEMPFVNKIFGYGEDSVVILIAKYFKTDMLSSGFYTDNTHNEFIQYLLTMGVFGLVSYISILVFSIKKLLEKRKKSVLCGAAAASVIVYACQSVVNISQPITTPIMFLLISMAGCEISDTLL